MNQQGVVQYALEPLAVELREVAVPEIGDDGRPAARRGGVGLRIRRAPGVQHALLAGERAGHARPRVRRHGGEGRARRDGVPRRRSRRLRNRRHVCGECMLCRTGCYNLCPTRKGFGYGIDGAMASYVKVPARCLHAIPDTLPFELACLAEPHAVAYNAMCVNSTIRPGDVVVVLGPGPIGLLCARMAALAGADPLIVVGLTADAAAARDGDARSARRTSSMPSRKTWSEVVRGSAPLGADLVCDASGASRPLELALALARPDGQVTKVGWSPRLVPDRHQSARPEEHPPAGVVQPQLPDLGARRPSARSPARPSPRRSSA